MLTRRRVLELIMPTACVFGLSACREQETADVSDAGDGNDEPAHVSEEERETKAIFQLTRDIRSYGTDYSYSDFKYDGHANLVHQIEGNGGTSETDYCEITYAYSEDDVIEAVSKVWHWEDGSLIEMHAEERYDEHGNITREDFGEMQANADGSGVTFVPRVRYFENEYDDEGRLVRSKCTEDEYVLNADNEPAIDPNGPYEVYVRAYEYDEDGALARMTEDEAANSFISEYEYDDEGRLSTDKTINPATGHEGTTEYRYDTDGNLVHYSYVGSDGVNDFEDADFEYAEYLVGISDVASTAGIIMEGEVPRHKRKSNSDDDEDATPGELGALDTAKAWLSVMGFSESGLTEQLEYEGYSSEEAEYAVRHCGADWNEQATRKAQGYASSGMAFSRNQLIEQLEYEGFTAEQAEHGVDAAGY